MTWEGQWGVGERSGTSSGVAWMDDLMLPKKGEGERGRGKGKKEGVDKKHFISWCVLCLELMMLLKCCLFLYRKKEEILRKLKKSAAQHHGLIPYLPRRVSENQILGMFLVWMARKEIDVKKCTYVDNWCVFIRVHIFFLRSPDFKVSAGENLKSRQTQTKTLKNYKKLQKKYYRNPYGTGGYFVFVMFN